MNAYKYGLAADGSAFLGTALVLWWCPSFWHAVVITALLTITNTTSYLQGRSSCA